ENRTDFNARAIFKPWTWPGDLNCFLLVLDLKLEITAHRFLRFRKRTVHHKLSVRARDNSTLRAERVGGLGLAALVQSFKPRHNLVHGRLKFLLRKTSVPMRTSE